MSEYENRLRNKAQEFFERYDILNPEEAEIKEQVERDARYKVLKDKLIKYSEIPSGCIIDKTECFEWLSIMENMEAHADKNLLLIGKNGVGKTSLVCTLAHKLIDRIAYQNIYDRKPVKTIMFVNIPQLIIEFKTDRFTEARNSIIKAKKSDILILDGMGDESESNYKDSYLVIYNLLENRLQTGKGIWITLVKDGRKTGIDHYEIGIERKIRNLIDRKFVIGYEPFSKI